MELFLTIDGYTKERIPESSRLVAEWRRTSVDDIASERKLVAALLEGARRDADTVVLPDLIQGVDVRGARFVSFGNPSDLVVDEAYDDGTVSRTDGRTLFIGPPGVRVVGVAG